MSYVYTGNSRSLKVTVTKFVNGVPQTPITYPTATDIANGFFTYSGGVVNIPTPEELAQMDESSYAALLIAFQTYVQEANPGLNFATATISVPAVIEDDPDCPEPGTPVAPVTTTTTEESTVTTTPAPEVTTTTTAIGIGICYNIEIPGGAFSSFGNDLYITRALPGGTLVDALASSFPDTGELIGASMLNICCVDYPLFKYGEAGAYFDPTTASIIIIPGGACTIDGECTSPVATTTTTPEPVVTTTTPEPVTTTTTPGD